MQRTCEYFAITSFRRIREKITKAEKLLESIETMNQQHLSIHLTKNKTSLQVKLKLTALFIWMNGISLGTAD